VARRTRHPRAGGIRPAANDPATIDRTNGRPLAARRPALPRRRQLGRLPPRRTPAAAPARTPAPARTHRPGRAPRRTARPHAPLPARLNPAHPDVGACVQATDLPDVTAIPFASTLA